MTIERRSRPAPGPWAKPVRPDVTRGVPDAAGGGAMRNLLPILTVLAAIAAIWYLAVAPMNIRTALDQAERAGQAVEPEGALARQEVSSFRLLAQNPEIIPMAYALDRPRLPTPVQVGEELWKTTGEMALRGRAMSKRSLIYHGWITLQSTLWGFALGTALGILGAVAIVYSRVVDMSLMPWGSSLRPCPSWRSRR